MESINITISVVPLSKDNLNQILIALHLKTDQQVADNIDPQLVIELTKKFRRVSKIQTKGEIS